MNQENAHLYLPLVQALVDKKTVQEVAETERWIDLHNPEFYRPPECYRIKPPKPREWWIGEGSFIVYDSPCPHCIHVREVLPEDAK